MASRRRYDEFISILPNFEDGINLRRKTKRSGATNRGIPLRLENEQDGKVGNKLPKGKGAKRPAVKHMIYSPLFDPNFKDKSTSEGRQTVAAKPARGFRCALRTGRTVRLSTNCRKAKVPNGQQ